MFRPVLFAVILAIVGLAIAEHRIAHPPTLTVTQHSTATFTISLEGDAPKAPVQVNIMSDYPDYARSRVPHVLLTAAQMSATVQVDGVRLAQNVRFLMTYSSDDQFWNSAVTVDPLYVTVVPTSAAAAIVPGFLALALAVLAL
mmetsp:Transcript_45297/g.114040  ORF Transcript_45297/g.114040 Transcript_45297/m.114040 type:complete len:143 (-) Transcript_45297:57-485(-)|eukprot:CAMPEP_0177648576 /NCGR_PEP_ID=MMETSP0447-20121125/10901_1 /TAXON_ID=0 /ORGANISM="Stygamoeba regulata, Strain BSH-02190019" /LENGTH=142 /DNA_ID=CAMNT_0019151225 /DNA_START=174 /DNA_END=602 /DNA_ORIENTATION=-